MAIQLLPLDFTFNTGANIYAVIHGVVSGTRQVWNSNSQAWEAYNSAHWAQYAVPLSEQTSSGYYATAFPTAIAGIIVSAVFYNNAVPTLGDSPLSAPVPCQGVNMAGIAADPVAAANQQQALNAIVIGQVAAGTLTASAFSTNVSNANDNAYQGRSILFITGALAGQGGVIIGYTSSTLLITMEAPFTGAPSAGDAFVIV